MAENKSIVRKTSSFNIFLFYYSSACYFIFYFMIKKNIFSVHLRMFCTNKNNTESSYLQMNKDKFCSFFIKSFFYHYYYDDFIFKVENFLNKVLVLFVKET